MTDIIFGIIILALLAVIALLLKMYKEQGNRLVTALVSTSAQEFKQTERENKPVKETEHVEEDLISMSEVDDDQFSSLIKKQIEK